MKSPGPNVLSPHLDDAVLSCWELIERPGSTVTTIFAGIPEPGTSTKWDRIFCKTSDSTSLMRARLAENEAALAGTGTVIVNLPYLDAQYLSEPRNMEDVTEAVMSALGGMADLYLPIAVGSRIKRHPDHFAVQNMGKSLIAKGRAVYFYADLPYTLPISRLSGWPDRLPLDRIQRSLGTKLEVRVCELSSLQRQYKRNAVRRYKSQFSAVNTFALGALSRAASYRWEVTFRPV